MNKARLLGETVTVTYKVLENAVVTLPWLEGDKTIDRVVTIKWDKTKLRFISATMRMSANVDYGDTKITVYVNDGWAGELYWDYFSGKQVKKFENTVSSLITNGDNKVSFWFHHGSPWATGCTFYDIDCYIDVTWEQLVVGAMPEEPTEPQVPLFDTITLNDIILYGALALSGIGAAVGVVALTKKKGEK